MNRNHNAANQIWLGASISGVFGYSLSSDPERRRRERSRSSGGLKEPALSEAIFVARAVGVEIPRPAGA